MASKSLMSAIGLLLLLSDMAASSSLVDGGSSSAEKDARHRQHHQQELMQGTREQSSKVVRDGGGSRAAVDQALLLTCHQCHSFVDGHKCIHLAANNTNFWTPCQHSNQTSCMVKRFSYTENATSPASIWSLERNCTAKCEPGCLILGERTKLYVCTSCCNQPSCNVGNNAGRISSSFIFMVLLSALASNLNLK